jgi:hypothetical protein
MQKQWNLTEASEATESLNDDGRCEVVTRERKSQDPCYQPSSQSTSRNVRRRVPRRWTIQWEAEAKEAFGQLFEIGRPERRDGSVC